VLEHESENAVALRMQAKTTGNFSI